jgi:hypothetical protein
MKNLSTIAGLAILTCTCLLLGCSAVVPMASATQDAEAKALRVAQDKSAIYVIRSMAFASDLHFATVDKDERVAFAAETYAVFTLTPGEHTLTFESAVNREKLRLNTEPGKIYFIEMDWGYAGGHGRVKVEPHLVSETEGKELLKRANLVSSGE